MRGQRSLDDIEDFMTAMRLGCCADVIQGYGDRRQEHVGESRESNNLSDDTAKFLLIVGKAEAGS